MFEHLPVLLRSAMYVLRGGFLIRPLVIAVALGIAGAVFSSLEEARPEIGAWIPSVLFPSRQDPAVAQVILSSIATSIMTVVSIVFAILLMTLTLASTQFSPRILIGFTRDRTTQWTLGVFLGTFSYCIATLPAARALPHPFVPVASVTGAMLLALVCVGWLIYFINHISQSISVNHIVDRLARETELVIGELMPYPRGAFPLQQRSEAALAADEAAVLSAQSGYIRFINIGQLVAVAKAWGISVHVAGRSGSSCQPACRLSMCEAGARAARTCRPSHRRLRYRSNAHPAAGCRVRHRSDRRYRAARYISCGQRSQHSDQLRGPAEPHHHPLDQSHPAAIALLRSAARLAAGGTVDEFRRPAGYGVRADQTLCRCRHRSESRLMRAYNDIARTTPHANLAQAC